LKKALIVILVLCTLAAAQNRQSVAVLPSVGTINQLDAELLTDKVREIASKTLPQKSFMLLKLDAIVNRIGAEELFRACKEGVCIGELARKASADYGARCDIFKRGNDLILKFELYNVKEEEIVETFTDYDVKDFRGMLAALEKRLPDAFRKMAEVYKESQEAAAAAKPEPKPETYTPPPPKPDTVKTYTLNTYASPSNGGTVSRNPYYNLYKEGTAINISASPSLGYTFAGWTVGGAQISMDDKITLTMNQNITLTAQFQRVPEPKPELKPEPIPEPIPEALPEPSWQSAEQTEKSKPKNKTAIRTAIGFDIAGAGLVVYGLIEDANAKKQTDDLNNTGAKNSAAARNAAYVIGGALLAAGISIHIIF